MGFTYNPFTYKDYQESADVRKANNQKILSEIAVRDYGDFAWADQGKYDKLLSDYENRPGFTYDINGDALYQQYKDKYTQQGKMAMADTMGQASAMTGGYGNSYAATVGNQAYQAQIQNLNDVIPELYQLAYDRYQNEGQDMLNMIGLMGNERDFAYGQWGDGYNRLASERDYYGTQYNNERAFDYGKYEGDRNLAHGEHTNSQGYAYNNYRDEIADKQWAAEFDEAKRQFDEQMALQNSSGGSGGGSGGNSGGGNGSGGGTFTDTLWNATGTFDDNGNPIFRNSEGKTMAFGQGVNPYTGTKHSDAKHGTFSNGYQPNNIGGVKLKNSGMSTNVTGKNQTIWEANGKHWLWRGDLNKYIEVDVSDLD
jgi:hypothetical protein